MKTIVYTVAFALLVGAGTLSTGCGNQENGTEQQESHEHTSYICPMNCEAGKTYSEPGICPVCKMDLVEAEKS